MGHAIQRQEVLCHEHQSNCLYNLDKTVLQQVTENPYLGILLSEDLGWSKHITKTASKSSSTLGFVRRNLKNCSISCRKTAYIALVRSVLEYRSVVWDPYLTREIDKLERIQRNGARFITGDYKSRHEGAVTNMFNDLHLPTLQDRRTNAKLVYPVQSGRGIGPSNIS